ncbi:hypothetical protein C8P63_10667 [Melghirimyces profundicolus]|uniref:Uncharacterized protein n=1 Tax=Melghirimyces profundicolus TaxID=1242148 RepID=A0A2T6C0G4_9BACL|nr:hypothetical protein C8P63_10667 [Melghirimyces profundicolus]
MGPPPSRPMIADLSVSEVQSLLRSKTPQQIVFEDEEGVKTLSGVTFVHLNPQMGYLLVEDPSEPCFRLLPFCCIQEIHPIER